MTDKKTGGSAFPNSKLAQDQTGGMTLRDWLAGQALNGMLSSGCSLAPYTWQRAAEAYEYAGAMLKVREE